MRIKANQLTILRIVLLPIPCYLLFGGTEEKVAALSIFTLLGITDYLDGYLARKQGTTTLGALMDPIADKIFITAIYIPLARIGVVPLWMILLLFIREFTVMELRSVYESGGIPFKTSELAKYKTTIQMIGGGFIIIIKIFEGSNYVFLPLGGCLLIAIFSAIITFFRSGYLGKKSTVGVILVGATFSFRLLFPPDEAIWAIMAVIVAVTVWSGIHYITREWDLLKRYLKDRFQTREWTSFLGITIFFPILYVSLLQSNVLAIWTIIMILSMEFATGGLNNLLTTLKIQKEYIANPIKIISQVVLGIIALILISSENLCFQPLVRLIIWIVLAITIIHCLRHFYINRNHFLLV